MIFAEILYPASPTPVLGVVMNDDAPGVSVLFEYGASKWTPVTMLLAGRRHVALPRDYVPSEDVLEALEDALTVALPDGRSQYRDNGVPVR